MRIQRIIALSFLFVTLLSFSSEAQQYHWRRAKLPLESWHSIAFNPLSKGRILFAGSELNTGVFRSDDGGITWKATNQPPDRPITDAHQVFCDPGDTNVVLAVTPTQFYRSTDGGWHWSDTSNLYGVDGEGISYNAAERAIYYAQNIGFHIWRSTDHGATWVATNKTPASPGILFGSCDVSQDVPSHVIEGSQDTLLQYSSDLGETWQVGFAKEPLGPTNVEVPKIVFSYYASEKDDKTKHDVAVVTLWRSFYNGVMATPDGGMTWQSLNSPDRHTWALDIDQRRSKISAPNSAAYPLPLHIFMGLFEDPGDSATLPNLIQETTDGGVTWHGTNFPNGVAGDTNNPLARQIWVLKYDTTSGRIAVAADAGLYIGELSSGIAYSTSSTATDVSVLHYGHTIEINSETGLTGWVLYDIVGRAIESRSVDGESTSIETASYPPGVYALSIERVGNTKTVTMIELP